MTLDTYEVSLWQPIESAPKDGRYIIILFGKEQRIVHWLNRGPPKWEWAEYDDSHGKFNPKFVTHWRPLPPRPVLEPQE